MVSLKKRNEQQSARWEGPGSEDQLNNTLLKNTYKRPLLEKQNREISCVWRTTWIKNKALNGGDSGILFPSGVLCW